MTHVVEILPAEHGSVRVAEDSILIRISPSTVLEAILRVCGQDGQGFTHW